MSQEEVDAIFSEDNFQCLECIEIMYHHLHQEILSNSKTIEPSKYYQSQNTNTLEIPVTQNNYNINPSSSHSLNPINVQLQNITNLNDKQLPIVNEPPTNIQENDSLNQNQDLNNLFLSVIHTNNITNEERLLILIKHDKNFQIHPYLMSIIKQRENMKKNFGSTEQNNNISENTNKLNSFENMNDNNQIVNNIFQNIPINNAPRNEFDFVLNNLCNKTQSSLNKSNSQFNPNIPNISYMTSNSQQHNDLIIQNKMNNISHVIEQKFPIDDVILFQNINKYNIPPDNLNRPDGREIQIKFDTFNKLIIVWDFLYTFHELLCGDEIVKYEITNSVEQFYEDLIADINNELFRDILISFLYLAVKNLKIFESNLNDKEVFIVKSFLDNPNSSTYNIFLDCICEILRVITSCISYSYLVSDQTKLIIKEILKDNSLQISIEHKIILLNSFVAISYETVIIKNKIRNELEKGSVFSIERDNLQDILKDCEKRKKEITKNEKFAKLGEQIQELQNKLQEYNEIEETNEIKKQKADIKLKIAKYESILKENETLDERKQDVLIKIQKTKDKITALKVPKKRMLGSDYKKCDYFCFRANPEKVYRKDKYNKKWYVLDNKSDIEEITNKLSEKGIREKKLKNYMKKILQEILIIEENKKEKIKAEAHNNENINENENKEITDGNKDIEMTNESKNDKEEESIKTEEMKDETVSVTENKTVPIIPPVTQDDPKQIKHTINEILLEIERKFTDYLTQFNKEWESIENRDKWKQIILHTDKEQNFISTLRMFNHRFKNPYKSDIELDEMEESEDEPYSIPEDLEKYVFIDENDNEFIIYETDPMKILSPKVKIWQKDIEINEVDKFYTSVLLQSITNTQKLHFALHFYEEVILGLIKRRETKKYGHIGIANTSVENGKR